MTNDSPTPQEMKQDLALLEERKKFFQECRPNEVNPYTLAIVRLKTEITLANHPDLSVEFNHGNFIINNQFELDWRNQQWRFIGAKKWYQYCKLQSVINNTFLQWRRKEQQCLKQ